MTEEELVYRNLAQRILLSGTQDFVRLRHPRARRNKELREAFQTAADMLFDDEYLMGPDWLNDDDEPMSLSDLCKAAAYRENVDIERLRTHVLAEAEAFAHAEELTAIEVPRFLVLDDAIYHVIEEDRTGVRTDHRARVIGVGKRTDRRQLQEQFCQAVLEVFCHLNDVPLTADNAALGKSFYKLLYQNDCFRTAQ